MTLYCATTNPGKVREFQHAAESGAVPVHIELLPGMKEIAAPEETGATFVENAVLKALYYSQHHDGVVFADDSGLTVEALGGAPGIHSARFAGPDATDEKNNALLMERMRGVSDRRAAYVCAIAAARNGVVLATAEGRCQGVLVDAPRGTGGFGYDPYFVHPEVGSFGEAAKEAKLAVSHRGIALRSLIASLNSQR